MRETLGVVLGILLIAGMGSFVDGVVDSRTGHGIAGKASGSVCMDDNILYLDDTCTSEYIDGTNARVTIGAGGSPRIIITPTTAVAKTKIDFQETTEFLWFYNSLYGKIQGSIDDGTKMCSNSTEGWQNNHWIFTTVSNCSYDHNFDTASVDPEIYVVSADRTKYGKLTHDQSKFVISGTGPVHVDRTDSGNLTKLTASGTLDSSARFVYIAASSADIVATLPTCDTIGYMFRVKRTDGTTWGVTVNSPEGIDGGTDQALSQYDSYLFHCDTTDDQYWVH